MRKPRSLRLVLNIAGSPQALDRIAAYIRFRIQTRNERAAYKATLIDPTYQQP